MAREAPSIPVSLVWNAATAPARPALGDSFIGLQKFWEVSICCHRDSIFVYIVLRLTSLPFKQTGNYAHIPNHIASCSHAPADVKRRLKELKDAHLILKNALPKGSQKKFFNIVWKRLHSCAILPGAAPPLPPMPALPPPAVDAAATADASDNQSAAANVLGV